MTEHPKDLVEETQRGRSERTPWLALWGVTGILAVLVCAILLAAILVYYFV